MQRLTIILHLYSNAKPMKKFLLALTVAFTVTVAHGQNLVPNPSFEIHDTCPSGPGEVFHATGWFQPSAGTSDYFNCNSIAIFQNSQKSRTGTASVGLFAAYPIALICPVCPYMYREYVEIKLSDSLQIGVKYYLSFWVSLAEGSNLATDNIGAFFSNDTTKSNWYILNFTPQINNVSGNYLTTKTSWTKVSGSFVAIGGEKFITIGNFYDDANTDTIPVPGGWQPNTGDYHTGYYYIDDVCLSTDSSHCAQELGINNIYSSNTFIVYPNPFSLQTTLQTDNSFHNATLTVYNCFGQTVKQIKNISGQTVVLSRDNLASGLYFIRLTEENNPEYSGRIDKLVITD